MRGGELASEGEAGSRPVRWRRAGVPGYEARRFPASERTAAERAWRTLATPFAGPNGQGKRTIKSVLPAELVDAYVNADELEKEIRAHASLDLPRSGVEPSQEDVHGFFQASTLLQRAGLTSAAETIRVRGTRIDFGELRANSYFASVAPDFIRRKPMDAAKRRAPPQPRIQPFAAAVRLSLRSAVHFAGSSATSETP